MRNSQHRPLDADLQALGERLAARLDGPGIQGLYLPQPVADETVRDEFGFLFLEDGSVGPFYVSMGGLLRDLWRRHPDPGAARGSAQSLLAGFRERAPAVRALALGSYNALSASLLRAAGFTPPDRGSGSGLDAIPPGTSIGMVGWFGPLIERLLERGLRLKVLELEARRVVSGDRVVSVRDARGLRSCAHVLCTASVLVNGTLEPLLEALGGEVPLELIGPSGSGLPDPLLARGIGAVGGSQFGQRAGLLEKLDAGLPWGKAGRKYRLDTSTYPGVDALLEEAVARNGKFLPCKAR